MNDGIHSQFNACMFKPECCQKSADFEAARQRIAELETALNKYSEDEMLCNLSARAEAAERDAAWIERNFFERKWSGTVGEPSYWQMAGPFRHALAKMRGETLHAAIDAALDQKSKGA